MPEPSIRRCSERRFNREVYTNMCRTLLKNTYAAIVALFVALLAMPTTMQAQGTATIILEAHDVWADGSGYQMLLDANHNTFGSTIPTSGPLTSDCNVSANLYDAFEYKIPAAADPSCTSTNVLVNGELSITIPAGTYDYCITNPSAGEKIWIVGDGGPDQSRADDFVFEAGKTYRFLIKKFGSGDGVELTVTGGTEPNMSRYITLTVSKDSAIRLDFMAAAAGTPVRIVSGTNTQDITVGTDWLGEAGYTAGSTTMTVYGDITVFRCSGNRANLTAIDLSHNTQLKYLNCYNNTLTTLDVSQNTLLRYLYCYGNNFSTQALDDIYCALPDRTGKDNGVIQPVFNSSDPNHATVLATNKANATTKNWKVQYYSDNTDIPPTTGTYVCGTPHMDIYITLTVTNGAAIKLDFKAASAGTPIRIVSGSNTQDITVGTDWYDGNSPSTFTVTAAASTMTIYGDLMDFACSKNGANLTALDPSHNTQLTGLFCWENNLSSLDVSKNTQLTGLYCSYNTLTSLDVSKNTQLTRLYCFSNTLSSLDVSKNTQLTALICHGNNFSTAALDDIFCALPDRTGKGNGVIQPVYSDTSSNHAIVLATNKANAIAKNWKVQYYKNDADIPATTGSYVCPQPNMSRYITLTVTNGAAIKLDFKAAAAATPIRIVSGSNTQDITVGTDWYDGNNPSTFTVTAAASTMTIYGDLIGFGCEMNRANLTALDLSNNTQLESLYCYEDSISSLDLSKNTQLTRLWCYSNKLSSLDVSKNTQLILLNCSYNTLSSLNVSGYTQLTTLECFKNTLTSLDVSGCTQLTELECYSNKLNSLDVSGCTQLTELWCSNNTLTGLDVSGCTQLTKLSCYNNKLTSLDVSGCTQLKELSCRDNKLTDLDVSGCTQLTKLWCYDNNFTTATLDDIYCALPDRTGKENGVIEPVHSDTSSNHAIVLATNKANAIAKNWKVQYYKNDADIPATTGKHKCPTTDIADAAAEQALTLYPNPVADVLYLSATARTIRIYDMYGTEVAHAADTDRIDVANLPAGIYTVNADGTVAKMIKR